MVISWNTVTEKETNKKIKYEYKDSYSIRYYSFDSGDTWNKNKAKAYMVAKKKGKLVYMEIDGGLYGEKGLNQ